jgi:dTMP kinase
VTTAASGGAATGCFITFEGGEGAGKSTLGAALAERARAHGMPVVICREPGGTPLGERLREALFGLESAPSALAELLTFAAARAELVATVIHPALAAGALVLCDRFADSTLAYQGYGRGLDLDTIRLVNTAATRGLVPNLTLLLDLDPAAGRARGAAGGSDYLEREALAFHERVRAGFLALAAAEPTRWLVLDAARPATAVSEAAWARVSPLISR